MKAVVDTNVVAYYLLGSEPFADECGTFWKHIEHVSAPASWQTEILSVLWMAVRTKAITADDSVIKMRLAAGLGIDVVPVRQLWRGALIRSIRSGISTYDTLFVELAFRRKLKLVTFDTQVLRTFPEVALRPSAFLSK